MNKYVCKCQQCDEYKRKSDCLFVEEADIYFCQSCQKSWVKAGQHCQQDGNGELVAY